MDTILERTICLCVPEGNGGARRGWEGRVSQGALSPWWVVKELIWSKDEGAVRGGIPAVMESESLPECLRLSGPVCPTREGVVKQHPSHWISADKRHRW